MGREGCFGMEATTTDQGHMRITLLLVIAASLLFLFFVLKIILSVTRFSAETVLCLSVVAVIATFIWSTKGFPLDGVEEHQPSFQLKRISRTK